jgi:hypothetical protein
MSNYPIRKTLGRESIKVALRLMLRWKPLNGAGDRLSIVLGVPWDLRHILSVNLQFVALTVLAEIEKIFVVFDRCHHAEMDDIERDMRSRFPELPMEFMHYPAISGRIIEAVHVSTFYNSMNTTLALSRCNTKYAVLHDFDLYPLKPDHFTSIMHAMRSNSWHFSGHELTHFDGLEDPDLQIGTWTLGIDVEWLRANYCPVDCFHRVTKHRGRYFNLDPFAWIQFQTPSRGLVGDDISGRFCHVKNLCSTYLRFLKGAPLQVAWRLHYLWYLDELAGHTGRLSMIVKAMVACQDGILRIDGHEADFRNVHASCANVLRDELMAMDTFLFGGLQQITQEYLDGFEVFVHRVGDISEIYDSEGGIRWRPKYVCR